MDDSALVGKFDPGGIHRLGCALCGSAFCGVSKGDIRDELWLRSHPIPRIILPRIGVSEDVLSARIEAAKDGNLPESVIARWQRRVKKNGS